MGNVAITNNPLSDGEFYQLLFLNDMPQEPDGKIDFFTLYV